MKLVEERPFVSILEDITDPLKTYRRAAKQALKEPEKDFDDPRAIYGAEMYAGEILPDEAGFPDHDLSAPDEEIVAWSRFDRDTLVAFTRVVRFLESLECDQPFFNHERSATINFLTREDMTGFSPTIDTGKGQLIRIERGSDAEVAAVTVLRSDGRHVTTQDLRFPFRKVKEFDAQDRFRPKFGHEWKRRNLHPRTDADTERELAMIDAFTGDSRLKYVARLYEQARSVGKATGQHIADELGVEPNSARQLIWRSRKRGFIPPGPDPEGKAD